ncbi:hypothetical protein RALTA_A1830 [Cupriavidus taiwanensis LMG 19424]|nr:hypothetical protein RALTA_A1830 [Cupriavidus taiwanensis LMG 19424]
METPGDPLEVKDTVTRMESRIVQLGDPVGTNLGKGKEVGKRSTDYAGVQPPFRRHTDSKKPTARVGFRGKILFQNWPQVGDA